MRFLKTNGNGNDILDFNPQKYFSSGGVCSLKKNGTIEFLGNNLKNLFDTLPTITFDIETISDNLIDVPYGENKNEEMVSFCLIGTLFKDLMIIIVGYKIFFTKLIKPDDWIKYNKILTSNLHEYYKTKAKNVFVLIAGYDTEVELLKSFLRWYSEGRLLDSL